MSVGFAWEPIASVNDEANFQDIIRETWEEFGRFKATLVPSINIELMAQWEKTGHFKVWTARADGLLVGGIFWYFTRHPNFWAAGLRAQDGGHYLHPQFRGKGWIAYKMWKAVLPALRELDVRFIDAHDNTSHPMGIIFRRLGLVPFSTHYGMEL